MPIVELSKYRSPGFLFNGHLQTVFPYLFRKVEVTYERERVELPDGDFIDLDWLMNGHSRLLILCHGLEGSSSSQYMQGMARAAVNKHWDVLALNFRSCSGEMNRLKRMYHHGEIEDLTFVISRILDQLDYQAISFCGFSLGGNVILKYLGINRAKVPLTVRSAVAISVPCDLASSAAALDEWSSYFYTRRFRKSLKLKFIEKENKFPGSLDLGNYSKVKNWRDFDEIYTTALTSFNSADEYYEQGSAKNFISEIRTTTLLINAINDPFLKEPSYPYDLCRNHTFLHLETPKDGGHVGFWHSHRHLAYSESRALQFLDYA